MSSSARPSAENVVVMDRDEESEAVSESEALSEAEALSESGEVSDAKVATHRMIRVESRALKDNDARWLKKGKKTYFGYKGFISCNP